MKRLSTLETTVDDGRIIQDFVIQVLDIHPEDIDVLANEADAYEIIRHVRVGDLLIADGRLKKNVSRLVFHFYTCKNFLYLSKRDLMFHAFCCLIFYQFSGSPPRRRRD